MKKTVLFMGSGKFAVEVLMVLLAAEEVDVVGVVSQKDKPVGRKKVMTATYVRQFCMGENIMSFEAENSAEILNLVEANNWEFDFLVVADYGVILKDSVLGLAKLFSLNVHGSLLPKYRGASPVHAALLNNDKETGVSIITMTAGLDAGPVWLEKSLVIDEGDFYESLLLRLGKLGGEAILEVLARMSEKDYAPIEQDESGVSFSPKIDKQDGLIEFEENSLKMVLGKYRAYKSWPGIFFVYKNVKFLITECEEAEESLDPAGLFELNGCLFFCFSDGTLKITKFKPESKNEMLVADFVRGNTDFFGKYKD